MKNEIRYRWVFILLILALVLAPVAVQIRLNMALSDITLGDLSKDTQDTSTTGLIFTRDGNLAYDGTSVLSPPFFATIANVVPRGSAVVHLNQRTLAYKYSDELAAAPLTVSGGTHRIEGKAGKHMTTTLLSGEAHEILAEAFGDVNGALYAYDYITGEVLVMISLPTGQTGNDEENYLTNRILGTYTSGSTIKVISMMAALSQNSEQADFTYTCTGSFHIPGSPDITCKKAHGYQTVKDALGNSCNCFFAEMFQHLDEDTTSDILEELGFNTYENRSRAGSLDKLTYSRGYLTYSNRSSFDDLWKLIGQGNVVSFIDMAQIAGAIVNDGKSASPHIVQSIYNPNRDKFTYTAKSAKLNTLVDPDVANTLEEIWADATEEYFHNRRNDPLDTRITHSKTGTSENKKDGREYNNRLLMGVMEEHHVAFMLVLEDVPDTSPQIYTIANILAQIIDDADL